MSNSHDIHSFTELEERKRALELEVEVSKRELAHSLGTSKVNLNDFLLKKVALPIGGAVAGLYLISKLRGRKRHTHEYHEKTVVKEVPAADDVAKYHYPVPPPRSERPTGSPQRQVAPATKYTRSRRPESAEDEGLSQTDKKSLISLATVASVAKIAVPAVKMIISAVHDYQDKKLEADTDGIPNQ